jgi:hypothetical protein
MERIENNTNEKKLSCSSIKLELGLNRSKQIEMDDNNWERKNERPK